MSSTVIDLIRLENDWSISQNLLPSEIEAQGLGKFRSLTLPNAAICADFVANRKSRQWVGVAVAVSDDDFSYVEELYTLASPNRCQIMRKPGKHGGIYAAYPEWNWLQLTWSEEEPDWLVEVQSSGVLWYARSSNYDTEPKVELMILEDIESLIRDSGEELVSNLA